MTWLIIGSVAQYHWFKDSRQPKDIDLLTPAKISGNSALVCVVDAQWHELADEIIKNNSDPTFATPNLLYTLKVSHAHWDIHFDKTLYDIKFLQDRGCELDVPLYHKLVKVWEKVHGEKLVNMNQRADTFWTDAVVRKYNHDHLHELVKFNDTPMHNLIRPKLDNTWCSEEMFNSLSEEQKACTCLEEMLVIAIERFNLTIKSSKIDRLKAIKKAHKKLCVSMTKGWFARYLIVNHFDLLIGRKTQSLQQLASALEKL